MENMRMKETRLKKEKWLFPVNKMKLLIYYSRQNKNTSTSSIGTSSTTSTTDSKLSNLVDFYAPPTKRLFMESGINSGAPSNTKVATMKY
jgi:hypothetical protein